MYHRDLVFYFIVFVEVGDGDLKVLGVEYCENVEVVTITTLCEQVRVQHQSSITSQPTETSEPTETSALLAGDEVGRLTEVARVSADFPDHSSY